MIDDAWLRLLDGMQHMTEIAQVAPHHLDPVCHVGKPRERRIAAEYHRSCLAFVEQATYHFNADEPGASGNKGCHAQHPPLLCSRCIRKVCLSYQDFLACDSKTAKHMSA